MTQKPVDEPEMPLEAIVEPAPVLESLESDALPPETAIIEHVQLETSSEPEPKPPIAIVDVMPDVTPPTEPMFARQPVAEIEAAAEKVARDIKQNADQIQAMLRTESAARTVDTLSTESNPPAPHVVVEMSKTLPEIAAEVMQFALRVFRSAANKTVEKIGGRLADTADLPAPGEAPVETIDAREASPLARSVASAEERFVDTQVRSDATASWVAKDDAMKSQGDPGENINLTEAPNAFVEGLPKPGETEFNAMAETAALEREKHAQPDDLTVIEGIGHKMAAALKAAGIDTFARLAQASDGELRAAIQAAGMRLAPTLATWAQQAAYAERGDWDGLKAFQQSVSDR